MGLSNVTLDRVFFFNYMAFSSWCIILQLVCLVSTGACRQVAGRRKSCRSNAEQVRWVQVSQEAVQGNFLTSEKQRSKCALHGKLLASLFSCQKHWKGRRTSHARISPQLSFLKVNVSESFFPAVTCLKRKLCKVQQAFISGQIYVPGSCRVPGVLSGFRNAASCEVLNNIH